MIGSRLAHYEILEELGHGGMGVVYKARDTHLDRFVAIKVLPAEAVANPERKRRFVQEAKSASALNHPNIVTIHDITEDNGTDFIAMEYVAGKPLDEIIPRRGMPLGELLKIAVQVADALTAAHAAGIVHRDLKPGNTMVGDDGRVRVLDFGLAKLTDLSDSSGMDETKTVAVADSSPQTEEGTILGTASYMSPEQAEGLKVDARSDIFSFGAMLYEMVTGRRPFRGESNMATLASIIRADPEELPEEVPHDLRKLINRCLRKDPNRRFQHIDDVKIALEELKDESDSGTLSVAVGAPAGRSSGRWLTPARALSTLILVAVAVAVGTWVIVRDNRDSRAQSPALAPVPFTTYPGSEQWPSFSPDGDRVAFQWSYEGQSDIYVKLIGSEGRQQLTTDTRNDFAPAWSPDGREIAFMRFLSDDGWALMLMPSIGGAERTLLRMPQGEWPALGPYLSWHPSGAWLVLTARQSREEKASLYLVSVQGGEIRKLTEPPPEMQGDSCAAFSPDGRELIFCQVLQFATSDLYLLSFDSETNPEGEPVRLTNEATILTSPVWLPASREVALAYGRPPTLALLDFKEGTRPKPLGIAQEVRALTYSEARNRLVYVARETGGNIWSLQMEGPGKAAGSPERVIASTAIDHQPNYSPDGSRIAFFSGRSGSPEVWISNSDGSNPVRLTSLGGAGLVTPFWSPDGTEILFATVVEENLDLYAISADGGTPRRLTDDPGRDRRGKWTRDKKWLYFESNRTGVFECYRMPGDGGEAVQITEDGGSNCRVSPDGSLLYYSRGTSPASVWKMEIEQREEYQIIPAIRGGAGFAPVSGGVYFLTDGGTGGTKFWFLDESNGQMSEVLEVPSRCDWLRTSKDGNHLIWSQYDESGADLMLIENFR